ncbi:MAG: hypothetical protein IJ661_12895 [Lachnospiraceae bacterium]|nr:hypothetical protein [Lachnospiraceae bacterium]
MKMIDRILRADERQQKLLEEFFKEFATWNWSDLGRKIVGGLFIGIGIIWQIFPWHWWELPHDMTMIWMAVSFEIIGIGTYLRGYRDYTDYPEDQRIRSFDDIFAFIPLSGWQLSVFRLKKAISLCFKLSAVTLVFQVMIAVAVYHEITAGNILLPAVGTFTIPVLSSLIEEYRSRRRG